MANPEDWEQGAACAQLRAPVSVPCAYPQCSAPGQRALNAKGPGGDHHDATLGPGTMTKMPAGLLVADERAVAAPRLVVRVVRTKGVLADHSRVLS